MTLRGGKPQAVDEEANVPRDEAAFDRPRYQDLLRAAGAALDRDGAGHVTIVEVDDGFLLRRERVGQTEIGVALSHVTREWLKQFHRQLAEVHPAVVHRRTTLWSDFTHSHQDFFRSLGYELDSVGARNIVVDELSDSLLVSYEQAGPDNRGTTTHEVVLGKPEIEELVNEAVLRRGSASDAERPARPLEPVPRKPAEPAEMEDTKWASARADLPYQEILSILGAFLDHREADRVYVLEAPDGMAVRYRQAEDGRLNWNRFTDHELPELAASLQRTTRILRRPLPRRSGGYEDLLLALGRELEAEGASGIVIGEREAGLTVSFQYLDSRSSFHRRKGTILLGPSEREALCKSARDKKRAETHFLQRLTRSQ